MKKVYESPVMILEEYVAEQYVAASVCGTSVGTPDHGHFYNKNGQVHCAFTSSNCGENAESCQQTSGAACNENFSKYAHKVITRESHEVISAPNSSYHNCHILSNNDAAQSFAADYTDASCGAGVAALMGLSSFEAIETAFS